MIIEGAVVSCSSLKSFTEQLNAVIFNFQKKGLAVEVQYKPANQDGELIFTALLLGRKDFAKE